MGKFLSVADALEQVQSMKLDIIKKDPSEIPNDRWKSICLLTIEISERILHAIKERQNG